MTHAKEVCNHGRKDGVWGGFKVALVCLCLAVTVSVAQNSDFSFSNFLGNVPNTQNRGPVLFPMSPGGDETSGVIVGSSGYGFVPPGSNRIGIRKAMCIGSVPKFAWRESEKPFRKTTLNTPDRDSNFNLPSHWQSSLLKE
uniref:Uncharacterized protein n=1 Tax=Timema bartmani TaxID=61472 RepID=A0A7R9EN65_9NEOP|nr:unnamed protein product [Timema bartmani]